MKLLALDLGTKTGWAYFDGMTTTSGTKVLATPLEVKKQKQNGLDRCCDLRVNRLFTLIASFLPVDVIYFEDVQFASSTYQVQLWASLRAAVIMQYPACKVVAVPVGTLKKFASGSGCADKDGMRRALPEATEKMDDNEIDALHLLKLALSREVKP